MRTLAIVAPASLVVLALAGIARGQVLYSNLGPGDSFNTGSGFIIPANAKQSMRFVPATSGGFNRVEAPVASNSSGVPVSAQIYPEVAGAPGPTALWAPSAILVGTTVSIRAFDGPFVSLVAGQPYWLVMQSTVGGLWAGTDPAVAGTTANTIGGTWNVFAAPSISAFRVSATTGVCCNQRTGACAVVSGAVCSSLDLKFIGGPATCSPSPCHACPGDFDRNGTLSVADVFAFLNAWFAGCP